ncbi:MAG: hypothetical protein ACI8Z1_003963 [Candidatus Azotimanducaceae bacterium]|jgi:hypothetical protein
MTALAAASNMFFRFGLSGFTDFLNVGPCKTHLALAEIVTLQLLVWLNSSGKPGLPSMISPILAQCSLCFEGARFKALAIIVALSPRFVLYARSWLPFHWPLLLYLRALEQFAAIVTKFPRHYCSLVGNSAVSAGLSKDQSQ